MDEQYLTYKKFNDEAVANELAEKLKQQDIPFELEDDKGFFDPSFANNTVSRQIALKIQPQHFATADAIIAAYYDALLNNIPSDYYLFEFSDKELKEILQKPDEWGALDYQLAQKILKERGTEINSQKIEELKRSRNSELEKPDKPDNSWVIIGYIFSIFGGITRAAYPAVGITVIGLLIGWSLYKNKKTLPDGRTVNRYDENQRKHGKLITIISIVHILAWVVYILFYQAV